MALSSGMARKKACLLRLGSHFGAQKQTLHSPSPRIALVQGDSCTLSGQRMLDFLPENKCDIWKVEFVGYKTVKCA